MRPTTITRIPPLKGAPQITRLLRDLSPELFSNWLGTAATADVTDFAPPGLARQVTSVDIRDRLAELHPDNLSLLEREALRITRLDTPQADALHLRLSESVAFECRDDLEELPGALFRSAWSFAGKPALFRHVERAMQMRSYREHRTIYEAYEVDGLIQIGIDQIDTGALEEIISEKIGLRDSCVIEAVELPAGEDGRKEIMLAVTTGGALANPQTFEPDKRIRSIQYRPAQELILVYKPDLGQVEVCGRQWTDRKAVARTFASHVLEQSLSERPLTQRNYDLRPFRTRLNPDIPTALRDRVLSLHVTEARFALGGYNRKLTVNVLPGEPIDEIAKDVLQGLRSRHGTPFLCDIELLVDVDRGDRGSRKLRFRVTNQNRSTLQAETDPELRSIGFELLTELGVVARVSERSPELTAELLPALLKLLSHANDTISALELRELDVNTDRLVKADFLNQRTIATEMLIDDDDLGPIEATSDADLGRDTASLHIGEDVILGDARLDQLLSWTINRDFVREKVLSALSPLQVATRPEDLGQGLFSLGSGQIGSDRLPIYLWENIDDLKSLERVDRLLRSKADRASGLVVTAGDCGIGYLGKHLVVNLAETIDIELHQLDLAALELLWANRRRSAASADAVDFLDHGDRAVLFVPTEDPWTIVGESRVKIVEKLYLAHVSGQSAVRTRDLLDHTGANSPSAAFGAEDWKERIEDRYIYSPRRGFWSLKFAPT